MAKLTAQQAASKLTLIRQLTAHSTFVYVEEFHAKHEILSIKLTSGVKILIKVARDTNTIQKSMLFDDLERYTYKVTIIRSRTNTVTTFLIVEKTVSNRVRMYPVEVDEARYLFPYCFSMSWRDIIKIMEELC